MQAGGSQRRSKPNMDERPWCVGHGDRGLMWLRCHTAFVGRLNMKVAALGN
jgi:hypothetical protein